MIWNTKGRRARLQFNEKRKSSAGKQMLRAIVPADHLEPCSEVAHSLKRRLWQSVSYSVQLQPIQLHCCCCYYCCLRTLKKKKKKVCALLSQLPSLRLHGRVWATRRDFFFFLGSPGVTPTHSVMNIGPLTVSPLCPGWPGSPSFPAGPWHGWRGRQLTADTGSRALH